MQSLSNSFMVEIAEQLAFLSAFMGGFAATFLATILVNESTKRVLNWVVCTAAVAACAFIVASVSFVMVIITLHPDAPIGAVNELSINSARTVSALGFIIGVSTLLISIGLSGWIRSKKVGVFTSVFSGITLILVFLAISGFK